MAIRVGEVLSATLDHYMKKFVDNIHGKKVYLKHLQKNGTKKFDGGPRVVVPLMYGKNATVMPFDGYDTLDVTPQEGLDSAIYEWEKYNVSIVISLTEEVQNSGRNQVINLVTAKIKQAEESLADRLNHDAIQGGGSAAKELQGIDTIIDTASEVGGISGATYDWWRSNVDSASEEFSFSALRHIKNLCRNGAAGMKPTLILTTQELYEKMFSLLTQTYYMNPIKNKESQRIADAGFEVLEFEGIPVSYDPDVPSGTIYLVNNENLKLGVIEPLNFKRIKKAQRYDVHANYEHIVFGGFMYTDRRKSLGKLTNKTV